MLYQNSISVIRALIKEKDCQCKAMECKELPKGSPAPLSHLLWMCDKIEKNEHCMGRRYIACRKMDRVDTCECGNTSSFRQRASKGGYQKRQKTAS
jgi:hypothetical protein